ncbi:MAG: enolase C-terminal domain-like protein, partial [Planctomycetota bacterium]
SLSFILMSCRESHPLLTDLSRKTFDSMQIRRLTAYHVPIAMRKNVRHASHERTRNDTLIVKCVLNNGSCGWGEGLPRTYVTGESIESVWRHLQAADFEPLRQNFASTVEIAERIDQWELPAIPPDAGILPRECFGNAARCAVELAILDAACRAEKISIGDLIHQLPISRDFSIHKDQVSYSGAVTSESPGGQWLAALKMRLFAFGQVKVKVGTRGINDADCLRRVRRVVGAEVDLRLDANEAWSVDEVAARLEPLMKYHPTCIEQPVAHAQIARLRDVKQRIGLPVMLDESLCCIEDAIRAKEGGWCDLFNVRLSKCGGLVRSLRIVAYARDNRLAYQLGCQVGETGILSAAGRHFACNVPDLRYLEGSFDRFLVRDRLTEQDLTFRFGGKGPRLSGAGLGVDVDECRIRTLAIQHSEII